VGDIHQPLHPAQLFTVEYPKGDRGGNEICVRMTQRDKRRSCISSGTDGYLKLEFDTTTKRGNGAPKTAGVSEESAHCPIVLRRLVFMIVAPLRRMLLLLRCERFEPRIAPSTPRADPSVAQQHVRCDLRGRRLPGERTSRGTMEGR
jgi:hypothetical protein